MLGDVSLSLSHTHTNTHTRVPVIMKRDDLAELGEGVKGGSVHAIRNCKLLTEQKANFKNR